MKSKRILLLSASPLLALCLTASAQADEAVWVGATSSDWATATNWDGGKVPVSGDDIIIADTTTNSTAVLSADTTIGTLTSGAAGTRNTLFTIKTGANTLTISDGVTATNLTGGVKFSIEGNTRISGGQT